MKTFSETERREIEERIQAACPDMKFENCRPDRFFTATTGELFSAAYTPVNERFHFRELAVGFNHPDDVYPLHIFILN